MHANEEVRKNIKWAKDSPPRLFGGITAGLSGLGWGSDEKILCKYRADEDYDSKIRMNQNRSCHVIFGVGVFQYIFII